MIIRELRLKNWIPYKGDHTIVFAKPKANQNITLIKGANKGGKSAITRALKWVLYGTTGDLTEYRSSLELFNRDALNENKKQFSVALVAEKDDEHIELTRTMTVSPGITNPTDRDFKEEFSIQKKGKILGGLEKDGFVKSLLPEEIVDFFFFDGEQLQKYKELTSRSDGAAKIKDQIEKVIQTPYLISAIEDLKTINSEVMKEISRSASDKNIKRVVDQIEKLAEEEDRIKKSIEELKDARDVERQKLSKAESDLESSKEAQKVVSEHKEKRQEKRHLIDEEKNRKELFRVQTGSAWESLASQFLDQRKKKLEGDRKELGAAIKKNRLNESMRQLLKQSETICALCGTELTNDQKNRMRESIASSSTENMENEEEKLREVTQLLSRISSSDNFKILRDLSKRYYEDNDKLNRCEIEIENLTKQFGVGGHDEIEELLISRSEYENEIENLNNSITELERELFGPGANQNPNLYSPKGILAEKKEVDVIWRDLQDESASRDKNEKLSRLCSDVLVILDESLEELTNNMKDEIEKTANDMYIKLTVEETFTKLDLDDSYGLHVLDNNNKKLTTSGHGNQIVAMSLLHGLKKSTRVQGPLLIDTPLARVDHEHRKKMLLNLSEMSDQVILLVHSGEIQDEGELEQLMNHLIGAKYKIEKMSDTTSSIERQ